MISDKELSELLKNKECFICGEYGDQVDHCHTTLHVRGILCVNCNTGLGKFKDDPLLLEFAKMYILASNGDKEWEDYKEKWGSTANDRTN